MTVVIVTHDPMVALSCRRIITLRDGRVDLDETVDQTYQAEIERIRDTPLGRLLLGRAAPGEELPGDGRGLRAGPVVTPRP